MEYVLKQKSIHCTSVGHVVWSNYCVGRRYMQIRYQFIGDLDTIIVDKSTAAPNLRLSALYGNCLCSVT